MYGWIWWWDSVYFKKEWNNNTEVVTSVLAATLTMQISLLQLQTYISQQSRIRHMSPCSYKGPTPGSKGGTVHKLLQMWQQPLNALLQTYNKYVYVVQNGRYINMKRIKVPVTIWNSVQSRTGNYIQSRTGNYRS